LWGGRFETRDERGVPAFDALNRSIAVDHRLWPFDVQLSKAWAAGLARAGVLTPEELHSLDTALDRVARRLSSGEPPLDSDEDIHTFIDRLVHDEAGDVASKLHTGRSRNDQVATATRLWTIDATARLDAAARRLQEVIVRIAESLASVLMPSYTHVQRAIPVSAAHWMLSHFWPLDRDRARLRAARAAAAVLPLGSGAVAGSAYPIPRELLRESLGFTSLSQNSIDAVGDRDFVAEMLFACAVIGMHLSRLAEDLILYGTSEFGFVQFGDAFTSGSSMMPQKRNPDALELARGSAARVLGDLTTLLATLKGLSSSYNKDLQDDKRVLFDAVDTVLLVVPAVAGALAECTFRPERMRAALSAAMGATDLADFLVRRGATFRDAHAAVGSLVRTAEGAGIELNELPLSIFAAAHPLFDDGVFEALSARRSVELREIEGGTGPAAVNAQIEKAKAALG
ncbi:MAG TPA: argininosuccinate lyase, partial [Gemmatimonadaceae bacterium]|nr:argininosuccinate lyase [Gemmatimonadaceae bacterium]